MFFNSSIQFNGQVVSECKQDSIIDIQSKKKIKQQVNLSLDGSGIKQVESARFLAVHIDENINWKYHVSHVYSKIGKLSGILCRARHLPRVVIRSLYYALIYPYLCYRNIAWGNTYTTRLEPIRRLQQKIVRIITFSKFKEHTSPLFKELLISPLDIIKNKAIALFMFKYFNNNLPSETFCGATVLNVMDQKTLVKRR